ncbi:MAG: transcription elongation factor GreA [Patescibacteria group bacterium]
MVEDQTFITKEGLSKLKDELDQLKNVKRKEVAKRILEAKELGDLSENAEYADAKEEQAFLEGRILEIEAIIRSAKIIEKDNNSRIVQIGSEIQVKGNGEERQFTIVGSNDADPARGYISNESPMGRAFIGKRPGENVEIIAPKGKINYEVVAIS